MKIKKTLILAAMLATIGTTTIAKDKEVETKVSVTQMEMSNFDFEFDAILTHLETLSQEDLETLFWAVKADNGNTIYEDMTAREFGMDKIKENLRNYFENNDPMKEALKDYIKDYVGTPGDDFGVDPIDGDPVGLDPVEDKDFTVGYRVREIKNDSYLNKMYALEKAFNLAGIDANFDIRPGNPKEGKIKWNGKTYDFKEPKDMEDLREDIKNEVQEGNVRDERRADRMTNIKSELRDRSEDRQSQRDGSVRDRVREGYSERSNDQKDSGRDRRESRRAERNS